MNSLLSRTFSNGQMRKIVSWSALAGGWLLVATTEASLRHRYDFESDVPALGTFEDSVGNADGMLFGNAIISGGQLVLPGGGSGRAGDHARLLADGPGGININTYTNATFAVWATSALANPPDWSRYFDLGGNSVVRPGDAGSSIFLTVDAAGERQIQMTISNVDPNTEWGLLNFQRIPEFSGVSMGVPHHVVVTFDGTNDIGRLYVNGALAAELPSLTHQLEVLQTDYALLGASLYAADPSFNGSIDQFEIYDTAFSAEEVLALYLVPEPGSLGLWLSGALLWAGPRRGRRA